MPCTYVVISILLLLQLHVHSSDVKITLLFKSCVLSCIVLYSGALLNRNLLWHLSVNSHRIDLSTTLSRLCKSIQSTKRFHNYYYSMDSSYYGIIQHVVWPYFQGILGPHLLSPHHSQPEDTLGRGLVNPRPSTGKHSLWILQLMKSRTVMPKLVQLVGALFSDQDLSKIICDGASQPRNAYGIH